MKTLLKILCVLTLNVTTVFAQEKTGQDIIVNVKNLKNDNGKVFIALYDSKTNFFKKRMHSKMVQPEHKACQVIFKNIPKGVYAVSLYHDENDNKKMDKNSYGAPKEAYGCSNNAKGFFGPPKWEDAKFEVKTENVTQNIEL